MHRIGISFGLARTLRDAWLLWSVDAGSGVSAVCLSHDQETLFSGHQNGAIKRWDRAGGTCRGVLRDYHGRVSVLSLDRADRLLLVGTAQDRTAHVRDVSTGRILRRLGKGLANLVSGALSADGSLALLGDEDQGVRLWDTAAEKTLRALQQEGFSLLHRSLTRRRARVLGKPVAPWYTSQVQNVFYLPGETLFSLLSARGAPVALSADGRLALLGSFDKTAKLLSARSGEPLYTLSGHTEPITSVCLSPDGRYALTGSADRTTRLFSAHSGRLLSTLSGHQGAITSLALCQGGRYALTGSADQTAILWDAFRGIPLYTFSGHTGPVSAVTVSEDGALAVTGGQDGVLKLWRLEYDWCFLEEMLPEAEALWEEERPSLFWPYTREHPLHWLEVWRDLKRAGQSSPSSAELERLRLFRARLLALLSRQANRAPSILRELQPSHSLLQQLFFFRKNRPSSRALLTHPIYQAGLVDPSLAADLGARLGIERQRILDFGWPFPD